MRRQASKRQFLRTARAWNERARLVQSPLFHQSDFFDPRDKVQVKYEMLRAAQLEGAAVKEASAQFGYSRESFYAAAEAFGEKGIVGLADGKRGPKQPRKLTPEVQRFLAEQMERDSKMPSRELAEQVEQQFAMDLHRRSVERFRSERKKKRLRSRPGGSQR